VANILTQDEASAALRCASADPDMLALLPLVDSYIEMATGRDWTADSPVRDEAKSAARMLLVRWHEDPGGMAAGGALGFGLSACLTQLEALAMVLGSDGVPEDVLKLVASVPPDGYTGFTVGASLVLVFNHPMASGATAFVTLEDAALDTVATTNTLDSTGKILTVNPTSSLGAGARYTIVIDQAPDVYGLTIEKEISFWTAP
jgi:hypothetical protein